MWNAAADELEVFAREHELEALTLDDGEAESGYSKAQLSRLIRERKIENVGKSGSPLVRRKDLPRKPSLDPEPRDGEPDLAGEILVARQRRDS